MIDPFLLEILRCPMSGQRLQLVDLRLVSMDGSFSYDVVDGIPCLIPVSKISSHSGYDNLMVQNLRSQESNVDLEGFMTGMLVPTCGNLFRGVSLTNDFPIPDFPAHLPTGLTVDVGCNWGRWSIAGAMSGHTMVGVDIHLESLFVARQLARKLTPANLPYWVLADARHLPFSVGAFDASVSYSVVQHFSRPNAASILREIGRVLKGGGLAAVQMPNCGGLKARLQLGRKRFSEGTEFDVRYYTIGDLLDMFQHEIGPSRWDVDCYFGLNVHAKDKPLLPPARRLLVDVAELFHRLSKAWPRFGVLADSVWITAEKSVGR